MEDPPIDVEPPASGAPSEHSRLDEAIISEVIEHFDSEGIITALAEKVAPRLANAVKIDHLAARLLEQHEERLSQQLLERLLQRLGE